MVTHVVYLWYGQKSSSKPAQPALASHSLYSFEVDGGHTHKRTQAYHIIRFFTDHPALVSHRLHLVQADRGRTYKTNYDTHTQHTRTHGINLIASQLHWHHCPLSLPIVHRRALCGTPPTRCPGMAVSTAQIPCLRGSPLPMAFLPHLPPQLPHMYLLGHHCCRLCHAGLLLALHQWP